MRQTKRLEHFLILRLFIALAGFALLQFWRESRVVPPPSGAFALLHAVLGAYLLEAVGSLILLPLIRRRDLFTALQVGADLAMAGAMVAATGGADSVFCPLFFASVLAASTVISLEGSVVCSSAATVTLAIASTLPYMTSGAGLEQAANPWKIASCLLTYGLALHGVSLLSSRLVGGLAEAMNLTEDIVETMGEGVIAADKKGRILLANSETRRLLGIAAGTAMEGKPVEDAISGDAFEVVRRSVRTLGESLIKTSLPRPDGTTLPAEIRTSILRGRRGAVRGTVVLLTDLTLRRQVDAAARRIAKLEELTEVARGIAHEVRNPLASMCGCAEEIAKETGISGQTLRLTEILVREAKRVDGIIEDFLSFARPRKLRRVAIDAGELMKDVGVLLRARLTDPLHRVVVVPPDPPLAIAGDRDLLTQLLLNLGINAIESLGAGPGEVRLGAAPKRAPSFHANAMDGTSEQGVAISVGDTGCGIPEEEVSKIFNPFYSKKARGTGLGLTIAHRIARIHGGAISLASAIGAGSSFSVWLPQSLAGERTNARAEAVWA